MPTTTAPFSTRARKSESHHLRGLLREHTPRDLEEALVRRYIEHRHSTSRLRNRRIKEIVAAHSKAAAHLDVELEAFKPAGLDDLVAWFEVLVPTPDGAGGKRNPDAVFTPEWVASMMAEEAITEERRGARVVDPSCGCGSLLIAAFRRIWHLHGKERSPKLAKHIIEHQLFGVDLDPSGVRRVELLLALAAIDVGSDNEEYDFSHLDVRDSLDLDAWGTDRFDVVLGNPPYIRYHQLTERDRDRYRDRFTVLEGGNFNLYFAFFELAHRLCADDGVVAYITPNAYFRASSAKVLRQWMLSELAPTKIVDFGCARVFDAASTYTALTFADHAGPRPRALRYAEGVNKDNAPLRTMPSKGNFSSIPFAELGSSGGGWRLAGKRTRQQLRLVQSGGRALGEVADIRFGAATLRDSLFLLDGTKDAEGHYITHYQGQEFHVEAAATRAAVKVPDVLTSVELRRHPGRIIFPYCYDSTGRALIWTSEQLAEYPETLRYLEAIRDELAKRDNGKKTYAAWYAYGRTQGLAAWSGERLLTPLYAAAPRFVRDESTGRGRNRIFLNGCAVTPRTDSGVSIELLEALLNSTTLQFYVEQTSAPLTGGYYSYQKNPLGDFHIHDDAVRRADEIIDAAATDRNALIATIYGVDLPERYQVA